MKKVILTIIISVLISSVAIKAGDNFISKKNGANNGNPCPKEMVFVTSPLGGFCIDKYEVSAGEKCTYLDPKSQLETRDNLDNPNCKPVSKAGQIPWRFISQNQAARACAKIGKRLATNEEWLAAALGTPDSLQKLDEKECHINSNWTNQPGDTGSGENCISSAGAYDMIGNVWEWVEGTVENGKYKTQDLPKEGYIFGMDSKAMPVETKEKGDQNYYNDYFWLKKKGVRAIARGGYWDNKEEAGQYAIYAVSEPSFAGTGIGFRCVK